MADDVIIPDRALVRGDIMRELGMSATEAERLLQTFGRKPGFKKHRYITQRELTFMQLDGRLAEWVKANCAADRQTVGARKGTA